MKQCLLDQTSRRRKLAGVLLAAVIGATVVAAPGVAMASATLASVTPAVTSLGGQTTVSDEYDRVVASGLGSAPVGGSYSISGPSVLSVAGGSAKVTSLAPARAVSATLAKSSLDTIVQSSIAVPVIGAGGSDFIFAVQARHQSDGTSYRGRVRVSAAGRLAVSFSRVGPTAESVLGTIPLATAITPNQKLNLQFQVTGTDVVLLQVRAWPDGTSRPNWQYEIKDTDVRRIAIAGGIGFWAYTSASGRPVTFVVPSLRADSLVLKPNAATTGVPKSTTLTPYTGPSLITVDGTIIENKVVSTDLRVQARNVVIRNSYLRGGSAIPKGNTGVIDANSSAVYNLTISHNTIIPDHPSYYRDGIVGHEFTAVGNHISRSNDGIGIFNRPGGSLDANVTVVGNYIHDLTHWNFDPAHSDGTHNDGIQLQGGRNIRIAGNNVVGSVVAGDGLGVFGTHGGSALLAKQDVSAFANLVIENNWFDDGQNSVCVNNGKYPTVSLVLRSNSFGRNQYDFGNASKYQIRVYSKSASVITGLNTNMWEDTGALLVEGRNTGIRFNSQ